MLKIATTLLMVLALAFPSFAQTEMGRLSEVAFLTGICQPSLVDGPARYAEAKRRLNRELKAVQKQFGLEKTKQLAAHVAKLDSLVASELKKNARLQGDPDYISGCKIRLFELGE